MATLKKKIMRFYDSLFMTKPIMQRSKLENEHNNKRTISLWEKYKRQINYCTNLLDK